MLHRTGFIWIIVVLVALRILGMVLVPLTDTTEARYAEIARLMVTTNDWITPWFKPDVPFWGKPPLAFWMEALSFKAFGINEFAVRLPSLLATLATSWVIWRFALLTGTTRTARNAVLIYITTALAYVASGAVMTDPFLTLGVTWSLAAFYLAPTAPRWYWRYGFFLGLAIGLLAKGPLALVLTFAPIVIWSFIHRSGTAQCHIKALPWLKGSLLTLLIGLPWYIAAELKTPGFLNYFIIGEHFMRFIQPGWGGGEICTAVRTGIPKALSGCNG
ncbi:ArnT family glycosyltransferase [Thiolapillus sp.]|uniref:ArnT family glycosyltransferase n=1 Tax=Thiolapillus sp. TaxID=2017437 RepID=UPI0025DF0A38|nr:phospholipid carrier-dependent glycosyltransferase [Thiolapillus sp.]